MIENINRSIPNQNPNALNLDPYISIEKYLELIIRAEDSRNINQKSQESNSSKKPPGRPSNFTHELAVQIVLEWIEAGKLQSVIYKYGIHRSSVWRWKRTYPEFRRMCAYIESYFAAMAKLCPELWGPGRRAQRRVSKRLLNWFSAPQDKPLQCRGRPTKYKPEYCDEVKRTWNETAEHLGVSRRTIATWCKKHKEFGRSQYIKKMLYEIPRIRREAARMDEIAEKLYAYMGSGLR